MPASLMQRIVLDCTFMRIAFHGPESFALMGATVGRGTGLRVLLIESRGDQVAADQMFGLWAAH